MSDPRPFNPRPSKKPKTTMSALHIRKLYKPKYLPRISTNVLAKTIHGSVPLRDDEIVVKNIVTQFRLKTRDRLGSGSFGEAVKMSRERAKGILKELSGVKLNRSGRMNRTVVLKFQKMPDSKPKQKEWLEGCVRELYLHDHLSQSACETVAGVKFCAKDYVPKLYFGGYHVKTHTFVTAMELVNGRVIDTETAGGGKVSYAELRELEKAILSLWLAGYVHNDFNDHNVLVQTLGTKKPVVKIIDFGLSTHMSDLTGPETGRVRQRLKNFIREEWANDKKSLASRSLSFFSVDARENLRKRISHFLEGHRTGNEHKITELAAKLSLKNRTMHKNKLPPRQAAKDAVIRLPY
jgi:serine/threonine protein kinase